jgi:hypothetical protein
VFTTTGANPIDTVIVMGVETAFLSAEPALGFQTQFQRLRTRVNVSAVGRYTVETPWRTSTYVVDALLPPGSGQNRSEISDPIDITFGPGSSVPGMVSPFLVATPAIPGFGPAQGYIGDGVTPTNVTGSPCGANYVRITAVGLDGITPIDINNGSNVVTVPTFTVMGKLAALASTPLAITSVSYTRSAGVTTLAAMAEGSASGTAVADLTVGTALPVRMAHQAARFYSNVGVIGALPATVSITASDPSAANSPNTRTVAVKDLVTIDSAIARCTVATRSCALEVIASSSDDGSGGVTPTLTLQHTGAPVVLGRVTATSAAVPAFVTVTSTAGGATVKAVTVINQ